MRKKPNVELNYKDSEVLFVNTSLPWMVQPPTFATVAEAYSYFTRHQDDFSIPDYPDDSDDLPDFVTSDQVDDFFVNPPQYSEPPKGGEPLPSPENEEGDEEPADESTHEAEG